MTAPPTPSTPPGPSSTEAHPDDARPYVFATTFQGETHRLEAGEALWDPGTVEHLTHIGVGEGWSCAEIGAGRGSVARWLADRVGDTGEVLATDLRTDRLEWLADHGVTVRGHDIVADDLGSAHFDLVHARMLVQHLREPATAVAHMVRALRPGGWLVIEDTDTSSLFRHATRDAFVEKVKEAAYVIMRRSGHQARGGLIDLELVQRAGLADVVADGRARVVRGGTPLSLWYSLWIEHLCPRMVAEGLVGDSDVEDALAQLADPDNQWLTQVMITVTGRKSDQTTASEALAGPSERVVAP